MAQHYSNFKVIYNNILLGSSSGNIGLLLVSSHNVRESHQLLVPSKDCRVLSLGIDRFGKKSSEGDSVPWYEGQIGDGTVRGGDPGLLGENSFENGEDSSYLLLIPGSIRVRLGIACQN